MSGKLIARESIHHEKRWGARAPLRAMAELITADAFETVCVRDASLSGAFVGTPRALPVMVRVALCPTGRAGEWLDGIVVRAGEGGYGIEWLDPGLHPVSVLLSLRQDGAEPPTAPQPRPSRVSWRVVEHSRR